jgi:demethylmenaquinone methyltransferase/2-methoxy-6-polyprenyl-1,4-benzoquinol methylase
VEAVESAVPLYESISEAISFGLAGPLRRKAVRWLSKFRDGWTLDLGSGPGVSTRLLLSQGFQKVVGLDPSQRLLKFAKSSAGSGFHPVVGVAESLPVRAEIFDSILTCFALRDVRNLVESLREISRVAKPGRGFAIVDVGKPDGIFRRDFVWLYVRFGMPLIALLLTRRRLRGNPFRMIIPTFYWLVTNDSLRFLVEREFGPAKLREFMLGGLVVLEAKKADSTNG